MSKLWSVMLVSACWWPSAVSCKAIDRRNDIKILVPYWYMALALGRLNHYGLQFSLNKIYLKCHLLLFEISLNFVPEGSFEISVKFVPEGPIDSKLILVQVMAWRQPGIKPLTKLMIPLLQFCRHFKKHCIVWNVLCFVSKFTAVCSLGSKFFSPKQKATILHIIEGETKCRWHFQNVFF